MSSAGANKLIPILALGTIIGVGAIILLGDKNSIDPEGDQKKVAVAPGFDADTPQDTLQTITQDLGQLKYDTKGTEESLDLMARSVEKQKEEMKQLKQELTASKSANMVLSKKIDLQTELLRERPQTTSIEPIVVTEPVDTDALKQDLMRDAKQYMTEMFKQQQPIDQAVVYDPESEGSKVRIFPMGTMLDDGGQPVGFGADAQSPLNNTEIPFYTIPKDAILMGATTITSLIGRVPIQGNVSDPAPFKIQVGADNMAANGYHIPGLSGMFLSGHATGDRALSCVRAYVESASFVFDDGRTLNISGGGGLGGDGAKLGWLSDAHGNACIPGKYITTAAKTGAWAVLLGLGTGAAEAYANSETTSTVGPYGGSTTTVTGNHGDYVAGQAISGGTRELTKFMNERRADTWDAVVVLAGKHVAFHADRELRIDYDANNRLVDYTAAGQFQQWSD